MEVKKLEFPQDGDHYLKNILEKNEKGINIRCGSVRLTKGEVLPFKTLDVHEVSYLISGKLEVSTEDGQKSIMNEGDLIYLNKDEVRRTETLENSLVLFFLFTET